jgi:hypothetical protein
MLERRRRVTLGVTIGCFAVAGAYAVLEDALNPPFRRVWKAVAVSVALFPVVVLQPALWWRCRGLRRLALEKDGRVCVWCGYDLSTLGEGCTCPECGREHRGAEARALWKNALEGTREGVVWGQRDGR